MALAMGQCLSVCYNPILCGTAEWIELVFGTEAYPKEIQVPPKTRVLPSGIYSQICDLEKFCQDPSTIVNLVRPTAITVCHTEHLLLS